MYRIKVNGKDYQSSDDKRLIDFLRDDLQLYSVKEGCSTGACGTCMVIVNGKARQSCVQRLSKLDQAEIITVEGISQREKDVYAYAFSEKGAVQCGFCIPGMVISAKALLDANPNPDQNQVKKAINKNICRCTGYVKIIEAICYAAELFRDNTVLPNTEGVKGIGQHLHRVDGRDKTLGTGKFSNDFVVEGQVYASAVRAPYPRCRVNAIDISKAEKHPDFIKAIFSDDVPFNKHGHIIQDWDVLIPIGTITRYLGDALVLIVAKTKKGLDEIKSLVKLDVTELEVVDSPMAALSGTAPLVHESGNILKRESLKFGDVDKALRESKYVVTRKYRTPYQEHAFMEPESALAMPDGEGIMLYTASQSIYDEQKEIARMLKVEPEKIHTRSMLVGGGFGGKEDMSVQHHAALAAWIVKKPVRITLTRKESMIIHPKKHPAEIEMTSACDECGNLTAMRATIITDTGAYASLGGPVLQRACTHAAGPYHYNNIDVLGIALYTNNPPCGAFRGFGVSQSVFAVENNINLLAEMVGISPWEIRYKNAIRPGEVLPNGQIADESCALVACLESVKEICESHPRMGIAACFKNSGIGVGLPDIGRCTLSVENGIVHLRTSAADMGQGARTIFRQIVCEATGLSSDFIINEAPDSIRTPNAGTSTASRQTLFTGEATRIAAEKLKVELDKGLTLKALNEQTYYGEFSGITDPMGSTKEYPKSHVSYSYGIQVALLDENGKLEKMIISSDIGTVVNPKSAEGQAEGGVVMGIGYALTEDYLLEGSHLKTSYAKLGIPRAMDIPPIDVIFVSAKGKLKEAYGAKGVGELSIIATGPAIAGAYYQYDGILRNTMPIKKTPYSK